MQSRRKDLASLYSKEIFTYALFRKPKSRWKIKLFEDYGETRRYIGLPKCQKANLETFSLCGRWAQFY